jgi:hypothetical protein
MRRIMVAVLAFLLLGPALAGQTVIPNNDKARDDFDDDDELVNGGIDLVGYNEVIDANNRLIRIGFETVGQVPGGVIYNNLTIAETEQSPPGTFIIDPWDTITVTGGFSIVFSEPTP